jgi:glycosyltransferase involved in cell wall biosynthesis/ubiquinone/menaquinone biosynthesis C-methylase UbiE
MWFDVMDPEQIVYREFMGHTNLVRSKEQEIFLKENGFYKAIAVGLPFLYPDVVDIQRTPNSLLVYPMHTTQCTTLTIHEQTHEYIEYIKQLREHFSLVVASIGYEDVRRGNWIAAFEKAGIPWIAGAWSHDKNALTRMHYLMRQFEFVTSNSPGSHCVYAAYCGCKVSFTGPKDRLIKAELDTHPHYKKYPHIASAMKKRDLVEEFQAKFPALCVEPKDATVQTDWAWKELGGEHKKKPEEIAELFEWKLRKLPSGRWTAINPHDLLTNDELFAKATAKSIVGQHDEAFKLTNMLKRRHVRLKDVEIIRARYFLHNNNTHAAREALKEELRHFPDNTEASRLFQELGGDALTPYEAKNKTEREFVTMLNTVRPFTRLNFKRAKSLYTLALRICQENIPGNFVECGVAAGGSTMLLALVVQKHSKIPRKVFAFDTFTGMPDPGEADAANGVPADDTGWGTGTCAAPEEFVQAKCRQLGVGDLVETRKGLFDATLPKHRSEIGQVALLHMDADWYSSTMTILDNLFDQLNDRALIQIDDYGAWDGCKKAILDYSTQHDLFFDVHDIDGTGVWCTKPTQTKKPAVRPTPPCNEAFVSPRLSPGFADLYIVRKSILERLEQAALNFSGILLDVGCGQMPYREHILATNPNITHYIGLDFTQGKYADLRKPDLTWDGDTIPLPDSSVDCAMATEVLEHCHNPLTVLKEIHRVLKPSGIFFFTIPFLWPIHDAPHDHYRYTPFAMQKLLSDAGFEDIQVEALGGWNASLAQMIGLWLKRAPMSEAARKQATTDLFPFYEQLAKTDVKPTDFNKNPMITGLSGLARAARGHQTQFPENNLPKTVVVTDQFPILSQTFILDQITGLMDRGINVEHWSMQRMDEQVVHKNVHKYGLLDSTRFISFPPEQLKSTPQQWLELFLRINSIDSVAGISSIQVHFGPNYYRLEPLFTLFPDIFLLVSFHGYDGSATFKLKGSNYYDRLFKRANMITTPSHFMKDNLVKFGCPEHKIVVHRYGKDLDKFMPTTEKNITKNIRMLSVARFVEKKGLEYAIAAFAKIPNNLDVEYRIAGDGPLLNDLIALARSLGVANKISFLGKLTGEEVQKEMASADIFVLTSITGANGDQEGVPVSLIEAQAFGLPVVSSLHAGIPELVEHEQTGFLASEKNIAEIAGYMLALIKNPSIRQTFSKNARSKVLKEFNIKSLNDALASYLRSKESQINKQQNQHIESSKMVICPICQGQYLKFKPFGRIPRQNALCPSCGALERHRLIFCFLQKYTNLLETQNIRMLHFAPEPCLEKYFRQVIGQGYLTADLYSSLADIKIDITNTNIPDNRFDMIQCCHVLEHIAEDTKAMKEICRILKPDGIALIMVPLRGETTSEDLSIIDPAEREKLYGQADHVRYYGIDIADKLMQAGFNVILHKTSSLFTQDEMSKMGLVEDTIFICQKKNIKQHNQRRKLRIHKKSFKTLVNYAI